MKSIKLLAAFIPLSIFVSKAIEQGKDRPNILLLTFEDSSADLFGCYGNNTIQTPNIDSLASAGLQYMNVWSAAPQSSPARSSLITGCYAPTYAMDLHRNHQKTPDNILFPQLLRDAGYYCTNNSKTDYNTFIDNTSCWDESSKTASYNSPKRNEHKSFFAVFNCLATHMGRIRSFHTEARRDYTTEGIYMNNLIIPPYLPDLPEVRSDYAGHLESIQDIDKWLKIFLDDLKSKNLHDNTIVFFFSDHGGCLPRGKGYLYETGLKVPFIVYFPPKWEHLSPYKKGSKINQLVDFTDIAPTILSLAGINIPAHITGKAFLGEKKVTDKKYNYAFTTNQHHVYMPSRTITDGRFKYIRRYIPYKYVSLRNYYQWGMPSNMAWDELILKNSPIDEMLLQPYQNLGAEFFFDLDSDPYELNNLIDDKLYANKINELRDELSVHIRETKDLGFFIPSSRGSEVNLYEKANKPDYPLNDLLDLVEKASVPVLSDSAYFVKNLSYQENEFRFWASVGLANLVTQNKLSEVPVELVNMINDPDDYVAAEACFALISIGKYVNEALKQLINPKNENYRKAGYSLMEVLSLKSPLKQVVTQKFVIDRLKKSAVNINIKDNEDSGLVAFGILVNLGIIPMEHMYGKEAYELGIKINKGRRKIIPVP